MEEILSTHNLSKKYGRIKAVRELNFTVSKGGVFGILGPNGSGKTTTLGMLLDVINPTQGEFRWFGRTPDKESRKKIGAILETPVFYPYLTGRKNLNLIAKIKEAPLDNINPVLDKVGLLDRADDKFRTYSLGMKQRLSIAAALLNDPIVLILDEPTNGLDPQGIAEVRNLITQIALEGKTIILASHLLDEVQKVCDEFMVLKKGKKIHQGYVSQDGVTNVIIEVSSSDERLEDIIKEWGAVHSFKKDMDKFILHLDKDQSGDSVNKYMHEKNILLSHIFTRQKSLEEQFLEIVEHAEE